ATASRAMSVPLASTPLISCRLWTISTGCVRFFFFNDPATTEIYTLSLHDAFRSPDVSAPDDDGYLHSQIADFFYPFSNIAIWERSEEHTSELQSQSNLVCRLLLEKKKSTYLPHAAVIPPRLVLLVVLMTLFATVR